MVGLKDQLLNLSKTVNMKKRFCLLIAVCFSCPRVGTNFLFKLNTMQDIIQNMCKTTVKSQH